MTLNVALEKTQNENEYMVKVRDENGNECRISIESIIYSETSASITINAKCNSETGRIVLRIG